MERIVHALQPGSPEWHQFRLEHHGASEAAAMSGLSKNVTRNELLHAKHTGLPREFSDFVQTRILDHGHKVEAMARPLVDEIIGEETYPATYSYGKLSASTDGITITGDKIWEHKQWNAELAASVAIGELPDEHKPQVQQGLHVTGADVCLFVVSDGTPEKFVHMWVNPDDAWVNRIVAGWNQFDIDLATYTPPEVIQAAVAAPIKALPALSIRVEGKISLVDNLPLFGEQLAAFISGIDKAPETDQGFADAEAAIKTLQTAQNALEAEESNALAQTASIDDMRKTVKLYADQARTTRLMLEKMVKQRKDELRLDIVRKSRTLFAEHVAGLNKRLGKNYMPAIQENFVAVIKGKRTIASLRDACDTELARLKIEANAIVDKIQLNLNALIELATGYEILFADTAQIVMKAPDDLTALVKLRISEYKAAKQKEAEELREKIRKEEEAKAAQKVLDEKAAADKLAREHEQAAAPVAVIPLPEPQRISATEWKTPASMPPVQRNATPQVSTASEVSGIKRLTILIDEAMADMTAGELQQVLDAVRGIKAGRKAAVAG